MITILAQLKQNGLISPLDYQFARLIDNKQQTYAYPQPIANLAVLLAALSSYAAQNGSTCLDPQDFAHGDFFDLAMQPEQRAHLLQLRGLLGDLAPSDWQHVLQGHIAFCDSNNAQSAPLRWENGLLYLQRNWRDEQQIVQRLSQRVAMHAQSLAPQQLAAFLNLLFTSENDEIDWQKIAVATALRQPFSLISGGPGTGKTRTVCSLLVALQWQRQQLGLPPLNIALSAPTGKAAARLSESINHALQAMPSAVSAELKRQVPTQAQTLHRLLGMTPRAPNGRYQPDKPLALDLLLVDEASMVDLNLFAILLNALSPHTRLVLLGDKDQLSSVEAGAVMAELCRFLQQGYSAAHCDYLWLATGQRLEPQVNGNPIRDGLSFLRKSYRFRADSGIKALAEGVNQGRAQSWADFANYTDLTCFDYNLVLPSSDHLQDNISLARNRTLTAVNLILQQAAAWYDDYLRQVQTLDEFTPEKIEAVFSAFNQVRLLSGLRQGDLGVEQLNLAISERLRQQGKLQFRHAHEWYHGKPIMVSHNDTAVELYNGDIGLFLTDKHGNSRVWFENGEGQYRDISPSRVPPHETAFVMTVHKSQGSEFAHTALVLPLTMNPILSRELIYTAVTRAKSHFTLFGTQRIWQSAVQQPIRRRSGLYLGLEQKREL
ncbi:exodeoxyribonuclease V subunit alpha [Testudinibacter sp. P80/BLE/0925]|uniref:exodeoxyribonuclease V subunit alpha n=1 Tax=Testudinibacter sp. TW-1 TaxID=3417757 RepID=UPI003D36DDEB